MVEKLALPSLKRPRPYKLWWINDSGVVSLMQKSSCHSRSISTKILFFAMWCQWRWQACYLEDHGNWIDISSMTTSEKSACSLSREEPCFDSIISKPSVWRSKILNRECETRENERKENDMRELWRKEVERRDFLERDEKERNELLQLLENEMTWVIK